MKDPNALNEYGVPLHACNGTRHDEHYWSYIRANIIAGMYGDKLKAELLERLKNSPL